MEQLVYADDRQADRYKMTVHIHTGLWNLKQCTQRSEVLSTCTVWIE